jgi:hypothetical protein
MHFVFFCINICNSIAFTKFMNINKKKWILHTYIFSSDVIAVLRSNLLKSTWLIFVIDYFPLIDCNFLIIWIIKATKQNFLRSRKFVQGE